MPRRRFASAGFVLNALNRAVGRATIFRTDQDYAAFEKVLRQAYAEVVQPPICEKKAHRGRKRTPNRVCAQCNET
jgi:hypothetical protein